MLAALSPEDVAGSLTEVKAVVAARSAFAALRDDSSVVTWGSISKDGIATPERLESVECVVASDRAFAALLGDGSVVTWGDRDCGGDSQAVQQELVGIRQLAASKLAFAALRFDGAIVTWGAPDFGGTGRVMAGAKEATAAEPAAYALIRETGAVTSLSPAACVPEACQGDTCDTCSCASPARSTGSTACTPSPRGSESRDSEAREPSPGLAPQASRKDVRQTVCL